MECWGLSKRKSWLHWLLMLMMIHILMVIRQTQGDCIEEERKALLEIKASHMKSFDYENDHFLHTWVDYGSITPGDCCDWERISCNTTTAHVTDLSLDRLRGLEYDESKLWALNVSLFLHFKDLTTLNLSANFLDKQIMKTGVERLWSLKKLEVLDLSENYDIDNNILPSLNTLTSLKVLDLSFTSLNGNFPTIEFAALENLEMLDLSGCNFNGTFEIEGVERVSIFRKLKTLNLHRNRFNESVITSLSTLSSLTKLDLSYNAFLSGRFPAEELSHLTNLEELDLSGNQLNDSSSIQACQSLSRLRRLESIDLTWNSFNKSIISCLSALPSLKTLHLEYAFSQGSSFPVQEFHNFLDLEVLDLRGNDFNGKLPMEELSHLTNLEELDLSGNQLNDSSSIQGFERGSMLRKLKTLNLRQNRFNESVITSLSTLSSLTKLDLNGNWLSGAFPAEELSHLTNLEELNLSGNQLNDSSSIQACKSLSRLRRLEGIDLSWNSFHESIISCLTALPSLKTLHLEYAFSQGSSFPVQEFHNFLDLEVLDLSYNGFNGTLPMEAFTSFHHLRVLDLSGNFFVGSIPSAIQSLSSLRALSLAYNNLNGSLPDHDLCELKNLHELGLSHNMFDGALPQCLNNLSSLKFLDISSNRFTGTLVPSPITNLTSLEYVDFGHNNFEGSFSFSSFSNHSKLEIVRFGSDNDKFEVETEEPIDWIPMFQLQILVLSNCNMHMPKGRVIPGFLLHQHKLIELDMSHNSLEGQFPNWLIKNNTNLKLLNLRKNLFGGHVPLYRNINMNLLDMSGNDMIGNIPEDIPKFFPNIQVLNLSRNAFSGVIPSSIGDLNSLWSLDLSDNDLLGEVPKGLLTNFSYLIILKLSKNNLHGQVLSGNLSWGGQVYLDSNNFTGEIGTLGKENSQYLTVLDISNNFFEGTIPGWISNMTQLIELVVRNNSFEGRFPCGIAPFSFLDISQNSFSGPIPSCLNLQYMEHLHLGSNRFTRSIPNSFRNLTNILTLDIGNNDLSGRVPKFLGELSTLRILLLRKNNFHGPIPKQLCQLRNVSLLDLSKNSLSGSIPSCLQNITGPSYLVFLQGDGLGVSSSSSYDYESIIREQGFLDLSGEVSRTQDEVEFTTKRLFLHYKGDILDYMAGLDLSCNKFTGEIPEVLGLLTQLRALNLSHNQLTGHIPVNFSNLTKLESLDLSSNGLTGNVPSEFVILTSLSIFNVSHNNLSGRIPQFTAQFGTFSEDSYEGNPLLCGPPLEKKCTTDSQVTNSSVGEDNKKWYDIDMTCFYASSCSTCLVLFLGFLALFYINPYWRKKWLGWVEDCMFTCYYFLCDLPTRPSMIFYK